jgi:hypothetical protein
MKASSRNATLLIATAFTVAAIAVIFLKGGGCTVETAMSPVISPDKQAAIDLYSKKCRARWSRDATKEKEYQVVVLRPITEPPPEGNRYKEADVVFEVQKGPEPMQLSFGSPSSWVLFEKLPEQERKNSLVIGCGLPCPSAGIRKQLHLWHGQPIHYILTETPSSSRERAEAGPTPRLTEWTPVSLLSFIGISNHQRSVHYGIFSDFTSGSPRVLMVS